MPLISGSSRTTVSASGSCVNVLAEGISTEPSRVQPWILLKFLSEGSVHFAECFVVSYWYHYSPGMTTHAFFLQLFCWFFTFTIVLSFPIPKDSTLTERTISARDAYHALLELDKDITAILPRIGGSVCFSLKCSWYPCAQLDKIANSSDIDTEQAVSVVYTLTSTLRSLRTHTHGRISFTSGAPSKINMVAAIHEIVLVSCSWAFFDDSWPHHLSSNNLESLQGLSQDYYHRYYSTVKPCIFPSSGRR